MYPGPTGSYLPFCPSQLCSSFLFRFPKSHLVATVSVNIKLSDPSRASRTPTSGGRPLNLDCKVSTPSRLYWSKSSTDTLPPDVISLVRPPSHPRDPYTVVGSTTTVNSNVDNYPFRSRRHLFCLGAVVVLLVSHLIHHSRGDLVPTLPLCPVPNYRTTRPQTVDEGLEFRTLLSRRRWTLPCFPSVQTSSLGPVVRCLYSPSFSTPRDLQVPFKTYLPLGTFLPSP